MATIELMGVGRVFEDGTTAVDALELTIGDGESFVLVGPSGCGKTSLLRLIAGLDEPTTGRILIGGDDMTEVPAQARDIGMMFQDGALYPHMSVHDNIAFPLDVTHARVDVERRVAEAAALVGVEHLLGHRPSQLSGGQTQRVALARAVVRRPRVLLLDEPLSSVDAAMRIELRTQIAALHRRLGTTMVYVTHDQVEAMALGDRLAVMNAGRVVQVGRPMDVYDAPRDVFVASFMGSPAMNVLAGEVESATGGLALRIGNRTISLDERGPRWPELAELRGRLVGVGVRPESLVADPDGELVVEIVGVEHAGAHQLVHAHVDAHAVRTEHGSAAVATERGTKIVACLSGEVTVDLWRPVRLAIRRDELCLFDLRDGHRLERHDR